MARSKKVEKKGSEVLPVPSLALKHHLETLQPFLDRWIEQKNIPPVLLFSGPKGIGKRTIATYLAQWILCHRGFFYSEKESESADLFSADLFGGASSAPPADTSPLKEPCGECPACLRALDQNWLDFVEIAAEGKDSESSSGKSLHLKIDRFRDLKQTLGFGAHEGQYKIILIRDAEQMTPQAANSVLKMLEEPPPGWIFFLTASDASLLLPTLVSRCQQIRMKPFTSENLQNLMRESEVAPERIQICAELSMGSWAKALSLASDENWDQRALLYRFIERPQAHLQEVLDWASKDARHLSLLVDQMELFMGDLLHWSVSDQKNNPENYAWKNFDGKRALVQHTKKAIQSLRTPENARRFWMERAEQLVETRRKLPAPLNKKLMTQDILLPWLSIA